VPALCEVLSAWPANHPPRLADPGSARRTASLPGKTAPLTNPEVGHLDARGTLVGPGKRTEPLQHHEAQQAGYQLAAKLAKLAATAQIVDEAGRLDRQDRPPVVKP